MADSGKHELIEKGSLTVHKTVIEVFVCIKMKHTTQGLTVMFFFVFYSVYSNRNYQSRPSNTLIQQWKILKEEHILPFTIFLTN